MRRLSRVPSPARTLFYEENIGRWAWAATRRICDLGDSDGLDPGPTKAIRGWHGQDWTFNRASVDSHAATQKIWIEGTEDGAGYAQHYRVEHLSSYPKWSPQCNSVWYGGDYFVYHCVIVRGAGWQKDALPSPLILTDLQRPSGSNPSFEGCVVGEN